MAGANSRHLSRGLHSSAPASPTPRCAHRHSAPAAAHSHSDRHHRVPTATAHNRANTAHLHFHTANHHRTATAQPCCSDVHEQHSEFTQFSRNSPCASSRRPASHTERSRSSKPKRLATQYQHTAAARPKHTAIRRLITASSQPHSAQQKQRATAPCYCTTPSHTISHHTAAAGP
jgi:hypothetical protein